MLFRGINRDDVVHVPPLLGRSSTVIGQLQAAFLRENSDRTGRTAADIPGQIPSAPGRQQPALAQVRDAKIQQIVALVAGFASPAISRSCAAQESRQHDRSQKTDEDILLVRSLAKETGITLHEARDLIEMIGTDRSSLLREARILKKR